MSDTPRLSAALDAFEIARKHEKAEEIAYLAALGTPEVEKAYLAWRQAADEAQQAGLRLLATPALGPSDIVLKARALRWKCPVGVRIPGQWTIGGAEPPPADAPFEMTALHFIALDVLRLAE